MPQPPGDLPNPGALSPAHRDLFPLLERQIPTRGPNKHERWHTATFSKPAAARCLRRADRQRSLLAAQALGDLTPKQPLLERQIPTRGPNKHERWHTATFMLVRPSGRY